MRTRLVCIIALWLGISAAMGQAAGRVLPTPQREVAVTFDDLPFVAGGRTRAELRTLSDDLLRKITDDGIPAVGFVNESKLYDQGVLDTQGIAILKDWLDAGLELGNHTYSHASLNKMPLADYEQDVIRGETETKALMAARNMPLRYFRHPFLQVGKDAQTRRALEKFLAERGYTIAPVTINHAEWVFAAAYDKAALEGDSETMQRVAEAYIPYMELIFKDAEQQSLQLFGHEIKQILLLHANALNAAHLDELAAMIRGRGYHFITLEAALEDPAYQSPNTYAGSDGVSWLEQWALTFGLRPQPGPEVPTFVRGLAGRAAYSLGY